MMIKSCVLASAVVAACMFAGVGVANAQGAVDLGRVWMEEEAGWQGFWTRVGQSNSFTAVWTNGNRIVRANLQMTLSGNSVSVKRDDTMGSGVGTAGCQYNGTIKGNSVTGNYKCAWSTNPGTWKATILR